MAEAKPQAADNDPSMEEILQSIRRIIAEEEKTPEGQEKSAPISSEVLELTQMVRDDGTTESIATPASGEGPVDVLASIESALAKGIEENTQSVESMIAPGPAPMHEPTRDEMTFTPPPAPATHTSEYAYTAPAKDTLLSDMVAKEASAAFRKLSQMPSPQQAAQDLMNFRSGIVVEDLMIELLRPMMKEWLDTHLASMVERIVEREVKRLSNGE